MRTSFTQKQFTIQSNMVMQGPQSGRCAILRPICFCVEFYQKGFKKFLKKQMSEKRWLRPCSSGFRFGFFSHRVRPNLMRTPIFILHCAPQFSSIPCFQLFRNQSRSQATGMLSNQCALCLRPFLSVCPVTPHNTLAGHAVYPHPRSAFLNPFGTQFHATAQKYPNTD